ncbi:MAG: pilus assembly protein TadG-related protein [Caldilineaceae bacterium]
MNRLLSSLQRFIVKTARAEHGQSLIQLGFVLVMLIGMGALAIDVGNGYLADRRMQNAADAAVLAGARELCMGQPASTAIDKAYEYLTRNGVPAALIDGADIEVDGGRISVRADTSNATFLAGILGDSVVDVTAESAAICGRATSACGLWPIGFELMLWEQVPCGERLVVWDADKDGAGGSCVIGGQPRRTCDCYDCDLDNNGADDFVLLTETSRGWLDFSNATDPLYRDPCASNGCGASELVCRLRNDAGGRMTLPICIAGIRGIKAGAKDDVNSRAGQTVSIPLYESVNCPAGSHCTGTSADSFYATRFGCIVVEGWDHNFELEPKAGMDSKIYKKIKSKVVYVRKNCGGSCMTNCGGTDGTAAQPWELRAVGLVE